MLVVAVADGGGGLGDDEGWKGVGVVGAVAVVAGVVVAVVVVVVVVVVVGVAWSFRHRQGLVVCLLSLRRWQDPVVAVSVVVAVVVFSPPKNA